MSKNPELLSNMSVEELDALAHCQLAPREQSRLSELLARQKLPGFPESELRELDHLVRQVDQLTVLKAQRARYTLSEMKLETAGS